MTSMHHWQGPEEHLADPVAESPLGTMRLTEMLQLLNDSFDALLDSAEETLAAEAA